MSSLPDPDIKDGIDFWNNQPASLDGVLGGYGSGSLPRVDALGSRLFLLHLLPELSTVPSSFRALAAPPHRSRIRALDVGAGIGRVTADVLLHLVEDVVLVEPVEKFVKEALARGQAATSIKSGPGLQRRWKGIAEKTKSVTIIQGTLQSLDPSRPLDSQDSIFYGRFGYQPPIEDINAGFDVIWCQWCLGHLNDAELVAFLKRSHSALRDKENRRSLIVVKENLCSDGEDGCARTVFDEQDSSLTRSDQAWKRIFGLAGLRLVHEQVQDGLPEGLYVVKMYALR